ncbi:MAG: GGDEF domain-containing protein [Oscillospiraceae bacterium]|nr:GGDEF domain-containing protein [Oscillospiraceae bacterium]
MILRKGDRTLAQTKRVRPSVRKMRRLKIMLIGGYAVIAVLSILTVSLLAIRKSDTVLRNKVTSLASTLNVQMKLNLDSYLDRLETIAALAFTEEATYTYDATAEGMDEYEALSTEKEISASLHRLCIMENLVDYGVVYRNNHPVGKLSNGTISLFGDRLFEDLHAMIVNPRTHDGWAAGYNGNYKRIYYVKELHENAILVLSVYASELEAVFDNPETMSDMRIFLTDLSYNLIYSSDADAETGTPISKELSDRLKGQTAANIMDDKFFVTVSTSDCSWYVICAIPSQIILSERSEIQGYIILTAVLAALLAVLLGTVLSLKLSVVVADMVSALETKANVDQLTGLLNKRTFEDTAASVVDGTVQDAQYALLLLDVDNFKGVNDTLGHGYGDEVLSKIGSTLHTVFTADDYVGRVGGDEFAVLLKYTPDPAEGGSLETTVRAKCKAVCSAFHDFYTGDDGSYKISTSIGAALFPLHGNDFSALYRAADIALYYAKRHGKDTYAFYDPAAMQGEVLK